VLLLRASPIITITISISISIYYQLYQCQL
jgi:hypothetical protein